MSAKETNLSMTKLGNVPQPPRLSPIYSPEPFSPQASVTPSSINLCPSLPRDLHLAFPSNASLNHTMQQTQQQEQHHHLPPPHQSHQASLPPSQQQQQQQQPQHPHLSPGLPHPHPHPHHAALPPPPPPARDVPGSEGGDLGGGLEAGAAASDDGTKLDHSGDENETEGGHLDGDDISRGSPVNGKRKRPLSVSCELCKQRKVKCDRGQPSCGWCSRNGALCEYKERKKPGLRAGYGRELEQRLDRLESIIKTHSDILQQSLTGNQQHSGGSSATAANDTNVGGNRGQALFRQNESRRASTKAEAALFLQKPTTLYPSTTGAAATVPGQAQPDFNTLPPITTSMLAAADTMVSHAQMPVSAVSPQHSLTALQSVSTTHDFYGHQQQQHHQLVQSPLIPMPSHQTQMDLSADDGLPPYDLLYSLVDLYFKKINTWCTILHRQSTFDSLFGPGNLDGEDKNLLHAIVATTLRFSTDARLTDEKRTHYHTVSKNKVLLYGMETSSVKSLQALVILALDLCGDGNGPPGWNIMALITRSVVQLGLAVETNSLMVSPNVNSIYTLRAMVLPEPKDFIEEESRRRLFWMIYLLDRYATIATAFEFALDDKEIDRTLPCKEQLWVANKSVPTRWFRTDGALGQSMLPRHERPENPENLGAFSYYIEVLGILTKIHKFLKKPVDICDVADTNRWKDEYTNLDSTLQRWKFNLPGVYGKMTDIFEPDADKSLDCSWVMLHATYHTAVIRLHSSSAYPTFRSEQFHPSKTASQRCHQAVENIHALTEFAQTSNLLSKLGPPFAFTLWVAARLLLVHCSTYENTLSPQITFLVDALKRMGPYWPVARRYSELLSRVLDEHSVAQNKGDARPSSVTILADMRRTAFDLDFLISRQPQRNHHTGGFGMGGVSGLGGHASRVTSVTPQARTPAGNELEYLDVFDFFNVPRLPYGAMDIPVSGGNGGAAMDGSGNVEMTGTGNAGGGGPPLSEFNITNFAADANSDWLFKQGGPKFMA